MALQGGGGDNYDNQHAPMRFQNRIHRYLDDYCARARTTNDVQARIPSEQACIRDHVVNPEMFGFYSRGVMEGGIQCWSGGQATKDPTIPSRAVVRQVFHMSTARTTGMSAPATGTRFYNCYFNHPNVGGGSVVNFDAAQVAGQWTLNFDADLDSSVNYVGATVNCAETGATATILRKSGSNSVYISEPTADFPIDAIVSFSVGGTAVVGTLSPIYQVGLEPPDIFVNCTFSNELDNVQAGEVTWYELEQVNPAFGNIREGVRQDCVHWVPNNTNYGDTAQGPMQTSPLAWFTPWYLGYRYKNYSVTSGLTNLESFRSGQPKMLFEPHRFWIELGEGPKRIAAAEQGLAYPKGGEKPYPADSYPRLALAIRIDANAALRACSWGLGQIMGFNHRAAGFASPGDMVAAFCDDEAAVWRR